jgi:NADPH-dependent 2,4-dienoyl-CoA reductase/sulfur reductase-like enzyme
VTLRDALIVGAGPAGMSAAIAAAECGLAPSLIDEQAEPGGQIYRRSPWSPPAGESVGSGRAEREEAALRRRFARHAQRIEVLPRAVAWGVFPGPRVAVALEHGWQLIEARALVLAAGAHEFVPPFPGWTLPGVMSAGGAQLMAKTMRVRPGRRALVAGTGPFLLVVAEQLLRAGVEVVGVVEASSTGDLARQLPALLARPDLLAQGARYLRALRRAGVPLHRGHVIVDAEGGERVTRARFAPCDADWRPDRSRLQTVEVDSLCVGYGFVPRCQLPQLAGCRLRYADEIGGWVPELSANQESSVPGVFVAGDGGGVAGAEAAALEGRLAGLALARRLGALDLRRFEERRRPVAERLARLRRFRAGLDRASRPRAGLGELAAADTVCCRCEEVTRRELDDGLGLREPTLRSLKTTTRLGMGPCQGRMCWPAAARYLADRSGCEPGALGPLSVRPPIRPVTLGMLTEPAPGLEAAS